MATVENIKNSIIDKIQSINNKDFLIALDNLILSSYPKSEVVRLNSEQKAMLEISEQDIKNEKTISQEAMYKRNLEWLNAM